MLQITKHRTRKCNSFPLLTVSHHLSADAVGHGRNGENELHRVELLPRGPRRPALLQLQQPGDVHHPLPVHPRHRHERRGSQDIPVRQRDRLERGPGPGHRGRPGRLHGGVCGRAVRRVPGVLQGQRRGGRHVRGHDQSVARGRGEPNDVAERLCHTAGGNARGGTVEETVLLISGSCLFVI